MVSYEDSLEGASQDALTRPMAESECRAIRTENVIESTMIAPFLTRLGCRAFLQKPIR